LPSTPRRIIGFRQLTCKANKKALSRGIFLRPNAISLLHTEKQYAGGSTFNRNSQIAFAPAERDVYSSGVTSKEILAPLGAKPPAKFSPRRVALLRSAESEEIAGGYKYLAPLGRSGNNLCD
jgi:hypothetical protein